MKKTISIILVLVMVLSMTAFAVSAATVEGNFAEDKGSITINKYNEDN